MGGGVMKEILTWMMALCVNLSVRLHTGETAGGSDDDVRRTGIQGLNVTSKLQCEGFLECVS